jgi:lactam utilization protein B
VNVNNVLRQRGLARLLGLTARAEDRARALGLALYYVRPHRALRSKVASVTVLAVVTQQAVRVFDMLAHVVVLAVA